MAENARLCVAAGVWFVEGEAAKLLFASSTVSSRSGDIRRLFFSGVGVGAGVPVMVEYKLQVRREVGGRPSS